MSNGPATLGGFGEFSLISRITAGLTPGPDVLVGPGDDGAVLATPALKAALRLGQEAGRFTYRVERGDIERFLAAIGDPV